MIEFISGVIQKGNIDGRFNQGLALFRPLSTPYGFRVRRFTINAVGVAAMKPYRINTLFFLAAFISCNADSYASDVVNQDIYCDVEYRVTRIGKIRDVKVLDCGPSDVHPKYRSRTKAFVKKFVYDPKTVDGVSVDSKNMKVRVVHHSKHYEGVKAIIVPTLSDVEEVKK